MISINDKTYPLQGTPTLSQLLSDLQINIRNGIAIAVNNTIISRTQWDEYIINDNDEILIIKATQGG